MINKIKSKINTPEKKRLLSNFFSLSVLQGFNYLLPLITLPYLVRVLGVEKFGLLAFATSTVAYFSILTDYGFNLTATKEIAINKNNKDVVIEIFSSVMIIKTIFMFISFFIILGLTYFVNKFSIHKEIYFITFGTVIGQILFPVWFFQGMEKMKYITYLNIFAKIIFTIPIFFFVKNENDFYFVPLLTSIGFIVAGIWSLVLINKRFGIHFKLQKIEKIRYYLVDGWHVFISNIAISLYTVSTTFILGLFTNNTIVGYYAGADKIINAFKRMVMPFFQAIYPNMSKKVANSKEEGLKLIRKITKYIFKIMFIVSILIFVLSKFIINILLGSQYNNSIIVLRILSLLPLLVALSNVFGIQTMLTFDRKKAFSRILVVGSVLNLILSFILVPMYQEIGSSISVLSTELFITVVMFVYLQKTGIKIIGTNNEV